MAKKRYRYGIPAVWGENNTEVATETKLMWVSLKGKEGRRRTFDRAENQDVDVGVLRSTVKQRLSQSFTKLVMNSAKNPQPLTVLDP
jgi:hypothetical protein